MQLPLQITIRDIPHSAAIETHIQDKAKKLEQFYNRLMSCRVVVKTPQKRKHQGKIYNVRIDLTMPGEELAITRTSSQDVYIALRDAFDAAQRRLKSFAVLQRGDGKAQQKIPLTGNISKLFFEEGFGFIETADGQEVYFHECVLKPRAAFDRLVIGTSVQLLEEEGEKGPQAAWVKIKRERRNADH